MEFDTTELEGLKVITLKRFGDDRGFFQERYKRSTFESQGIPNDFVQINHSRSAPGVLRGLHFQHDLPQGKLVGCITGSVWDVAVDIRHNSPTYGQHFGIELSESNGRLLWIPAGFAHGFCVLGDQPADVMYSVDAEYNPKTELGILWNDPEFAIKWPVDNPVLSGKDEVAQSFSDFKNTDLCNHSWWLR